MTSIGKYKLLDEMGVGAVGTTYRATDTFRNREMVVKVLNPAFTGSPELREQLRRDLSASAELRHPHIIKVRDLGEVDGAIYIATEFLNGVDLRWHIERKILSLADKIELMVQVCGALAFAHSKGVAHGNIKPGNIFVTGKDATILDFGIGKCLASIVEAGGRPGALLPNYFAPEQVLGKPFKARSDVFSVAVVLFELLTRYPFPADANLITREIVHTTPELLRKLDPEIPEDLEQLMVRALEKDPEKRLERADEFAAGLYLISQKLRGPMAAAAAVPVPAGTAPAVPEAPEPREPALAPPAFAPTFGPVAPTPVASVPATPPPPVPIAPAAVPVVATPNGNEGIFAKAAPVPQRQRPAPIPSRKTRWIPYAIAAVLTFCISLAFFSRQSMHASQTKSPASAPNSAIVKSAAPTPVQQPALTPPLQASGPAAEEVAPAHETAVQKPSEEQVLLVQVKALWASGKYAQALSKVDDLLAAHPDYMEGRIWKKKIHSAQEAESALK